MGYFILTVWLVGGAASLEEPPTYTDAGGEKWYKTRAECEEGIMRYALMDKGGWETTTKRDFLGHLFTQIKTPSGVVGYTRCIGGPF